MKEHIRLTYNKSEKSFIMNEQTDNSTVGLPAQLYIERNKKENVNAAFALRGINKGRKSYISGLEKLYEFNNETFYYGYHKGLSGRSFFVICESDNLLIVEYYRGWHSRYESERRYRVFDAVRPFLLKHMNEQDARDFLRDLKKKISYSLISNSKLKSKNNF
ncbi:MAG: hypothetical protein KQH79_14040 [Bacteroidetes bacterium]|nr:hypothetical protein [Bacteroidota bacterium]